MTKTGMSLLTVILIIIFAKYTLHQPNCGNEKYKSFVEVAFQNRMFNAYRYICGGVLISSMFVLTTKQCIEPYQNQTIFAFLEDNTVQIRVDFIIMHNKNPVRDLCLLQLTRSVETNKYIETICLPTIHKSGSILTNKEQESAEWEFKDHRIEIVNKKQIKIESLNNCKACFDNANDLLCFSGPKKNNSVGGILIKKTERTNGDRYELFGMFVNEEPDCDDKNMKAIIDITYYLQWIQNNMMEIRVASRGFERRQQQPKAKKLTPLAKKNK